MKRKFSYQLQSGMITAEDVYSLNGQLLVPKGAILTQSVIDMMNSYSVQSIRILDEEDMARTATAPKAAPAPQSNDVTFITKDVLIPSNDPGTLELLNKPPLGFYSHIDEHTRKSRTEEVVQYKSYYEDHLHAFETTIENLIAKNTTLDVPQVLDQVLSLLKLGEKDVNFLEMLLHIKEFDSDIYSHSINVALLCHILAGWLQMDRDECRLAAACGLFHDIGKILLPNEILHKADPLTPEEKELLHSHAEKGYQFLSNYNVDDTIKKTALMHHERCDGSGYPHNLTGAQIDQYAKIVTICDIYNAMTSARVHRPAYSPFYVIEAFENDGLQKYDTRCIITFLENAVNSYVNCPVILNNKMTGYVVFINRGKLGRPVIQCGHNFIDLAERPDLYIDKMLPTF